MRRDLSFTGLFAILCFALAPTANAQLYLSTAQDSLGMLYTVNPATAASTLVGPVRIGGLTAVDITGLAFQPVTNTLYAVTSKTSTSANSLLTINVANGNATLVGSLGALQVGDITFSSAGTLYGWQKQGVNAPCLDGLVTISLATGASTLVAPSGLCNSAGSGLAFALGTLFVSIEKANGKLRTVNPATGLPNAGVTMNGSSTPIGALAADPTGTLYGALNNNTLVAIDPASGAVANIGSLPSGADALAFLGSAIAPPGPPAGPSAAVVPAVGPLGLLVLGTLLALAGLLFGRTR